MSREIETQLTRGKELRDATYPSELEIPLKYKYSIIAQYKFGGKKRKTSTSGGVGAVGRRKKRARTISQYISVEQYRQWKRATENDLQDPR